MGLSGTLEFRLLLWNDRPCHWADLEADAAVDAGVEINPIELGALGIGSAARVNASHRAGINAIGHAFADVGDDCVCHQQPFGELGS